MISDIETAIIARITAAKDSGALGYDLFKVTSYAGELSPAFDIIRALPAMWVVFGGEEVDLSYSAQRLTRWRASFTVIVAAKSLRNEAESRHGSGIRVGSYQMMRDVKALLSGQTFDLKIAPLKPLRVIAIANNSKKEKGSSQPDMASIYGVQFETTYTTDNIDKTVSLDDFTTFHSDWDIPAFGNVDTELPASDTADATDTITLEN